MRKHKRENDDYIVIFRRYRRTKDGRQLDAFKYGLKAWPIKVPRNS